MSEKKYVHSGAFMLCDKCVAPIPIPLTVTSQLTNFLPGGLMATDFDELPVINVPPFGMCAITHVPCTYVPQPPGWSPVQESIAVGPMGGKPLLEDSKIRCMVGGQISLYLTKAAAMATLPDIVSRGFDSAYAYLESVGPPFGGYLRNQVGMSKGIWQGVRDLGLGVWDLAQLVGEAQNKVMEGAAFAVLHPVEAAHNVAEATKKGATVGWEAVSDGDNWLQAGEIASYAIPGVAVARGAMWLSDEQNRAKVSAAYDRAKAWEAGLTDYERSTYTGRAAFEIAMLVVPELKAASLAKAARAAEAVKLAEAARLAEAAELARGSEAAAGGMRMLGEVKTGAKAAEGAELGELANEVRAGAKECEAAGHPVDVATGILFTQVTDFSLPGPIPLVWERTWFSCSTHAGVLGHGWHHAYDLDLTLDADGGAILRLADDRRARFAALAAPEQRSFNRRHKLELALVAGTYRVWDVRERVWYVFEPAATSQSATAPPAAQRLCAVENTCGQRIHFAYSPAGHLATIIDSAGRVLPCDTDAAGRLLALYAPDPDQPGQTFPLVRYTYDAAGDLLAAIDALGHAMRYAYTGHLLVRETFRSGLNFYFKYDGQGPTARCVHTWGDGGVFDTKLRFDGPNHTTVWDSYNHEREYYHERGLVIHSRDAVGAVRQFRYNLYAELERAIDPLGQVTRYDYDGRGNQTEVCHPDGATVSTAFNEQDLPIGGMDANGNDWQWAYDEHGHLLSGTDPADATTSYNYDSAGNLVGVTNTLGRTSRLHSDNQSNATRQVAFDDSARSRINDPLGRLVELTDAKGNKQHYQYDRLGQISAVQAPDGTMLHFGYDVEGQLVRVKGGQHDIEFAYNPMGQLLSRKQDGAEIRFHYNLEGHLTRIDNEHGESHRFELDPTGSVSAEIGFDNLTRRYARDLLGRVVHIQRPAGRSTAYTYDAAGRVVEVLHNETERATYAYRPDGTLLEANTALNTVEFERDPLGRLLREQQNSHAVISSYNATGQRLSLDSSLGAAVTFERDLWGHVCRVRAGDWQSVIEHDNRGLEIQRRMSGGVQTGWHHDVLGRPTSQRTLAGSAPASHRSYHWQGTSQLVQIEEVLQGTTQFEYGKQGGLAATNYADGTQEWRLSDAVGNLFRTADRSDRRYGKGGQLREANGTRYRYDEEGNLTQKTTPDGKLWSYAWDGAGQLSCVTRPDGYAVTFTYDALGRRVSKRFRGKITRWVWDGNNPLHEWYELEVGPDAGAIQDLTTWLFEDEACIPTAKLTAKAVYSVVCDHLGTPLELYDGKGTKTWQAQLDSYGAVRQGRGQAQDCPFRYQGQYEDIETGLYYNRFRYYDSEVGCYISQDPIGVWGGLGLYQYTANPNRYIDALGLSPFPLFRGTTAGFPGREGVQRLGISPATTDPRVATVIGGEAAKHGTGVVHIATAKDLAGVTIDEGNVFAAFEKEVMVGVKPTEFAARANTISLEKSREILRGMGHDLPRSIASGDINTFLKELLPMSEAEINSFYQQASKFFFCKKS